MENKNTLIELITFYNVFRIQLFIFYGKFIISLKQIQNGLGQMDYNYDHFQNILILNQCVLYPCKRH